MNVLVVLMLIVAITLSILSLVTQSEDVSEESQPEEKSNGFKSKAVVSISIEKPDSPKNDENKIKEE